jgi:hypothetical protein
MTGRALTGKPVKVTGETTPGEPFMPFAYYVQLRTVVKSSDCKCDECGVEINTTTATIVTDETGTFPVCNGCKDKF